MLSLVKTSKRQVQKATVGGAVKTMRLATPRESWQGRMFIVEPLSASIIHDLRNPLAAISASAEMLTDKKLAPDHAMQLGRNIHKAAGRMRELLADLADVTQGKPPDLENCRLHEILAAACEDAATAASQQGVRISLDVSSWMEVKMARNRIKRVFVNLITNALEAMPSSGNIRIAAREAGCDVLIEVEDTGPGIPPEIYDQLFDPFVTVGKKDGLGLGLALSRRTVRDHGGDMWIEPADGARFVIRLPLSSLLRSHFMECPRPNPMPAA
jgi:signal transduction histidine kinase